MLMLDKDLDLHIEELEAGRRELKMDIGVGVVRVLEIPSGAISPDEWELIQRARHSYFRMWGSDNNVKMIAEDPFDALDQNDPFETFHYIGQVIIPGASSRFITMRKVSPILTSTGETPSPPEDATFWLARNIKSGETIPLWDLLMAAVKSPANVAAISRTGTYPYRMKGRTPIEQERNAIAFAAIQVLTTQEDYHTYFICQLCQEFQRRVHSIDDVLGNQVMLEFTRTEDTLHLPPEWRVRLDNNHPGVKKVKTFFPGYWVESVATARVMRELLQNGALTYQDLHLALKAVPTELTTAITGNTDEIDQWLSFFTKPKHFKYLIPVIKQNDLLRHKLIHEVAERPFSSTLIPRLWRQSALKLLRAAKEKYGSMTSSGISPHSNPASAGRWCDRPVTTR